jgi:NADPH:quinone reductase-like Zn-dependent oxidoreductase
VRAVVITRHGGPEVLQVQDRPDPAVGAGEVRIAVRAAGINFADLMARSGVYPDAPPPPCVVGYEVAGEVESVGDGVEGLAEGDHVLAPIRFGGYAELATVPAADAVPLPDGVSFEQGASFPVNFGTAYAGLVIMGGLREGNRVLVHSAAGGVGIAATQIAKARGAEVFGTASASKHDAIRAQGVDHPIDYRSQDFAEEVSRITGGEGVDVIMDALGPASFRKDYRLLRPGGRLIMFGIADAQTGATRDVPALLRNLARMPLATIPWWKSLSMMNENKGIFGLNMLHWWDQEGSVSRLVEPLSEGLESGELKPVIAETFPFERAGEAHDFIQQRRNVGKVVLTPNPAVPGREAEDADGNG